MQFDHFAFSFYNFVQEKGHVVCGKCLICPNLLLHDKTSVNCLQCTLVVANGYLICSCLSLILKQMIYSSLTSDINKAVISTELLLTR